MEAKPTPTSLVALLRPIWEDLIGIKGIGDEDNLFELGAHSLMVPRFLLSARSLGHAELTVADVYDQPTLAGLAERMLHQPSAQPVAAAPRREGGPSRGMAIIGMAVRAPASRDVDSFWAAMLDGKDGIRRCQPGELDPSIPESVRSRPNFVAARGAIDDVGRFDAGFFGVPSREAMFIDPQHRQLLELAWHALEHAGIPPGTAAGRIGVYVGVGNNTYINAFREQQPEMVRQYGEFPTSVGAEKDYAATRVASKLNLNGPAVNILTACSTGLVAVAEAWHSLATGQCDIAIAGGVTVIVPQEGGYLAVDGGMDSADGHCRPFDAGANGTVFSSGGGLVVMRRVEEAVDAGDTIYAVVRGVGMNNDGGNKASFTAPSVSGQAGAIRMALEHAGANARNIGYVEAHGTGTQLGDPIEIEGLTRAWRNDTADCQFAHIGSLKGNFGHTIAAAGVLGLIKAALALHHEVIPGTLHYRTANPQIDFAKTPFRVAIGNTPWPRGSTPRWAATSSFGVGGTNAHAVLEEAPPAAAAAPRLPRIALPVSAASQQAALARASALADHLERAPDESLESVLATLTRGRQPMGHRLAVAGAGRAELVTALRAAKQTVVPLAGPRVVFMFPGQGAQSPGMARSMHAEYPAFRDALERCLHLLPEALGQELRPLLLSADGGDSAASRLAETRFAQPALFCVSYAYAAWLEAHGVRPAACIGHSIGELAAACVGGMIGLEDALRLVATRGEAMWQQPRGSMLAVRAAVEATQRWLPQGVEIAGVNAPELTVVAGPQSAIDTLAVTLEAQSVGTTRLRVSHAFHSALMDGAMPLVAASAAAARFAAPLVPVYSCVSGRPLGEAEVADPSYWGRQLRAPVLFSAAVVAEASIPGTLFLEVGPGQALAAFVRQHRTGSAGAPRLVTVAGHASDPGDAATAAFAALGQLWCHGVVIRWPLPANCARATLPGYPFMGERHWFPPSQPALPSSTPVSIVQESTEVAVPMSRIPNLQTTLSKVFSDVSGLPQEGIAPEATFLDQGMDSLSLTQVALEIDRVMGVKVRFRRLLEDLDTIEKLAVHMDAELPAGKFAPAAPAPRPAPPAIAATATPAAPAAPVAAAHAIPAQALPVMAAPVAAWSGNAAQNLIQQQLMVMSQQLALLSGAPATSMPSLPAPQPTADLPVAITPPVATTPAPAAAPAGPDTVEPSLRMLVEKPFGASARITLDKNADMTAEQSRWVADFIARYNAKSGKSKSFSQQHRKRMADPRVVTGFNPLWKDLVYPLVVGKSKGAYLWDVDGNEYIDLLSCFGANLLGYQPDDLVAAMVQQLNDGIEVGPQHPLAAEVAELFSEFTGHERVAFCNTGSEAVMGAMRVARTVTGRRKIAIFSNSYHGIFDEVIVRGTKQLRSLSAAPGILANTVENILVLDWNSEDSLRILREQGHELAAIMIEPVQNKYPHIQPREFVHALRKICDEKGCAFIVDEVVTGFRLAPGGAQEFYGVRADIAAYGKIVGGGLPMAVIAGNSHWLDALDGGHWQFGDDSYPEAGVTYFAGTYVRHPLALAAAKATLLHLKSGGREFYRSMNDRTQRMIDRLNAAFAARNAPVKAVHCASLWRLSWDDNQRYVSLFYYLARFLGLHVYEQFGHFVTEGMGEKEIDRIVDTYVGALDELMRLGFILPRDGKPPEGPSGPGGGKKATPPAAGSTTAPLTPGQGERWLAASFDTSARRALNESLCVALRGAVDRAALDAALADVVARHPAFQLKFSEDEPAQSVDATRKLTARWVDLSAERDADLALDRFCVEADQRVFDLGDAPLAGLSVLTLSDGRTVVHLATSHIVCDGWGCSVFVEELAKAYAARQAGRAPELAAAESPLEFARVEDARWTSTEAAESRAYWTKELANPPAAPSLGDRQPAATRTYGGDTWRAAVAGERLEKLHALGKQHRCTAFQLLLACVSTVVRERTGSQDFVLCIPFAGQSLAKHGPLIADGVLDLPLRLRLEGTSSTLEVLPLVKRKLMDAAEFPLATQGSIARALNLPAAGNRPPFTGIYFNLNPPIDLRGFSPLHAEAYEPRKTGLLSELFFNFYEEPGRLALELHYSTEFFSEVRVREVTDHLLRVVDQLVGIAAPAAPSADAERIAAWNATAATPVAETLPAALRLAEKATRQGRTTAVINAAGESLSYAALEAESNRIAHHLSGLGIRRGALVGICMERSPRMLSALLGILKTGAAYVPLDPGFPEARLRHMAEDAQLAALVTEEKLVGRIPMDASRTLRVDTDAAVLASLPATAVALEVRPEDPAYVIYTSGSTGKPKGVAVPHRAVANFLGSMAKRPGLTAADRLLAVTTLSFDIAVLELYLPLMVGGRVVLATRMEAIDGEALARLARDSGSTVLQATPSTWRLLLAAGWSGGASFKGLIGGEPVPRDLIVSLAPHLGELWNMYGPTETTVWSTCGLLSADEEKVHIGTPIDNTTIQIISEDGRHCAVGEAGELCIGGLGVALGYFGKPEMTAERFVTDPLAPGAKMYRTGDRARWRDDGKLEHLGRMDLQIKLRGYRIELGEIEAVLATHPAVAQAFVLVQEFGPDDQRLVAYILPKPGAAAGPAELKAHAGKPLPAYMVPQHYMTLDKVPLLPNGKTDRKSFPRFEAGAEPPAAPQAAPQAASAQPKPAAATSAAVPVGAFADQVAAQMAGVLGLPSVGLDDNFFELGGHSLLAAKLSTRLGELTGQRPGLRPIFEHPTPRALAAAIGSPATVAQMPVSAGIPVLADQSIAPLSMMQERLWFLESVSPGTPVNHLPSAHRLVGPLDLTAFRAAFLAFVQRHAALRSVIDRCPDGLVQRVLPTLTGDVLPFSDLSSLPAASREEAMLERLMELVQPPFDFATGPLFRAALLRLTPNEHVFIFVAHHLVWDGWSFDILYKDMSALYEGQLSGRAPDVAPLPISYGDFSAWHRDWMNGDELARQTAHWKQLLTPLPPALDLPIDHPRPAVATGEGASFRTTVSLDVVARLHEVARRNGTTLFTTLFSAFALLLHRYSGQPDICIGTPVRGRDQPGTDAVVGFFVNVLPLRSRLDGQQGFGDWLAATRQVVTDALACPDVPFDYLVRELDVPRDTSRSAVYQTLFSFQDARERISHWGNVEHHRTRPPLLHAAQDISLWCVETHKFMDLAFTYDVHLFDAKAIERLAASFIALMERIAAEPEAPLPKLLAPVDEDLATLAVWNDTQRPLAARTLIEALPVGEIARERGSAVAVTMSSGEALDYSTLDRLSNQVAHALRALGITRGQRVGIHLERSPHLLVAMLGILKTGAAYVPLDPGFPEARLRYMVDDAGIAALLTSGSLTGALGFDSGRTLALDRDADAIARQPATALQVAVDGEDAAYVIYTSGSTGKPKGVAVPHRAAANFLASMARQPGLSSADTVLAVTTLSFDIAVLELLLPLHVGAGIVMASRAEAVDGQLLATLCARHGITLMQATPTTWRLLLSTDWRPKARFSALVGGEPVPRNLVQDLGARGAAVWNMYGPTETTVWSTCTRLHADVEVVTIGTPIDNTTVTIRDGAGLPCPIGAAGELCIGGTGLALGYHGRADLTARAFIPDPQAPGQLYYRTGDRARWRHDGQLEHLGRLDHQVKLRGYRIELGEIEAALTVHPSVAQAVVGLRDFGGAGPALVGWIVTRNGDLDADALRSHLRTNLPEYMVPQYWMRMPELPLTANGKIDRQALPTPAESQPARPAAALALPETATERQLAEVWRDLLGVRTIGRNDRFLEIGGHSLLAMQAQARMNSLTGREVDLRPFLFDTLSAVAAAYADAEAAPTGKRGLLKRLLRRG